MRKILVSLVSLLTLSLLFGCSGGGGLGEDQILSVRDRKTGKILTLGDGQEEIDNLTGGDVANSGYAEDQDIYLMDYWGVDGIRVNTKDDLVCGIAVYRDTRWEISSGARIGMDEDKAWELYKGNDLVEKGLEGGILLSYDENLNQIPFDQDSPFRVVITFEDGKIDFISISRYVPLNQ